jgi:hypothetical protein
MHEYEPIDPNTIVESGLCLPKITSGQVTRSGLNQLNGLSNLHYLKVLAQGNVAKTEPADELMLDLSGLKKMKDMNLSGLSLQDSDLAFLKHLPLLESLMIQPDSLTGAFLRHLRELPELIAGQLPLGCSSASFFSRRFPDNCRQRCKMAKTKTKTSRAAHWQKHISRWSKSGLTQAEYCRRNRLSAAAFHWWKGHLRKKAEVQTSLSANKQQRSGSPNTMQFVEVHGVSPAHVGRGGTYEVVLSRGRAIRVGRDFDSDVLKRLIAAVES